MASSTSRPVRFVIIGGGLAGMTAAHRLIELALEDGRAIEVDLLESGSRLGGAIGTEQVDGYLVDTGADSFLTNKPGAVGLCRRLGIEHRLVATDERYRGALVLFDGRPCPVPDGFQLMSPSAVWPMIRTPILSTWGKFRMACEMFVPSRQKRSSRCSTSLIGTTGDAGSKDHESLLDESLASFAVRRLGREAFERLVQPLIGGIYTSDPEKLSLAATLPRFLEMERDYGSLLRATLFNQSEESKRTAASSKGKRTESSGARYGLFAGLAGGMEDLLGALRSFVTRNVTVRLNTRVDRIVDLRRSPASMNESGLVDESHKFQLELHDGTALKCDSVIVATPAHHAATLLSDTNHEMGALLSGIQSASSALVVTGHRLADIAHPMNSFGLVIPQRERREILAVSFSSRKFPDRAPPGCILLRTFVGGALQPHLFDLSDTEMLAVVQRELADIFGVRRSPDFARIYRHPKAMPQYHVGHVERVAQIDEQASRHHGLFLTGIAYHGVGVPDVIAHAESTAQKALRSMA